MALTVRCLSMTAPKRHTDMTKRRVYRALDSGVNISQASRQFNVSRKTIYEWVTSRKQIEAKLNASKERVARWNDALPPPLYPDELETKATRALKDFGYWRHRYFGRRTIPWQEEAAYQAVGWVQSPETEFVVVNCPPGGGKTTLFTHDIPAWLICRDRTIRILLGHNVQRIANTYTAALRRTLERTRPLPANPAKGRIAPAEASLAEDYGRFKPTYQDAWRGNEFTVMMSIDEDNPDESGLEDKEPTCSAFGMEAEFLGTRANLVVWDDLVTGDILHTLDRIENQRRWWLEEGQTRVEPGGCLILEGQRMGPDDLYRYCLDQRFEDTDESRYRHIVFPAHNDDHCLGADGHGDPPPLPGKPSPTPSHALPAFPAGCLLDPVRIPWYGTNGLLTIRHNTPAIYEIQYQQRDVSSSEILVPEIWIHGGRDAETGEEFPGCWDQHRDIGQVPRGLSSPWFSIISVDPSATNWWAVGWWIYHPASEQRFLIDLHHERMDGPDLLDWNANNDQWYGVLEEWVRRAKKGPCPITHLIVEANACQRWLLQYDHTKRWQRHHQIVITAHQTSGNKLDPELGIQSVAPRYKFGNVRLPGTPQARAVVAPLVHEATRYQPAKPKAIPDDCLMQQWFVEFLLPKLARPAPAQGRTLPRPSWMRRGAA
jgi:transposase-like protein